MFLIFMIIYLTHSGQFHRGIMHTLEHLEKGFLQMVVLSKQPLYGQILVELEEN